MRQPYSELHVPPGGAAAAQRPEAHVGGERSAGVEEHLAVSDALADGGVGRRRQESGAGDPIDSHAHAARASSV